MFLCLSWIINKLLFGNLFGSDRPRTIEDEIEEQRSQEGNVKIYRNNQEQKASKPSIQDLGEDVDFEEIDDSKDNK